VNEAAKPKQPAPAPASSSKTASGAAAGAGSSSAGKGGASDGTGRKRKHGDSREGVAEGGEDGGAGTLKLNVPFQLKKILVDDWEFVSMAPKRYMPALPVPEPGKSAAQICEAYLAHLRGEEVDLRPITKKVRPSEHNQIESSSSAAASADLIKKSGSGLANSSASYSSSSSSSLTSRAVSERDYRIAKEMVDSLKAYFDKSFPVFLLYRYERLHFDSWWRERREALGARPYSEICCGEHFLRLFAKLPELLSHAQVTAAELDVIIQVLGDFLKWMAKHHKALFSIEHYYAAHPEYVAAYEAASKKGSALQKLSYDKVFIHGVTPTDPLHRS
jgi:hypothetical protein